MLYEDENCIISYNFWCENGNSGFVVTNKTSQTLYIDLSESFFIKNGMVYDYYQNRKYTFSSSNSYSDFSSMASQGYSQNNTNVLRPAAASSIGMLILNTVGASMTTTNSKGVSVANSHGIEYSEKPIVAVPQGSSRLISEYCIEKNLFALCNMDTPNGKSESIYMINNRYKLSPNDLKVGATHYTENDSPLYFSNSISYKVGSEGKTIMVKNSFYISDVTNRYGKDEVIIDKYSNCQGVREKHMKDYGLNRFYNTYLVNHN